MCTFTIIRIGQSGYRLGFNRDELRTRELGEPPVHRRVGQRRAIMPVDPVSGGTWLGVNDAGVSFALLNVYTADPRAPKVRGQRQSRGRIIPSLLGHDTAAAAARRAGKLPVAAYPPFTLLCCDPATAIRWRWDGLHFECEEHPRADWPVLYTSSGMGDHLVEGPRRELFDTMLGDEPDADAQQAFHAHSWPECPELSVAMSRSDAHTISFAAVTVDNGVLVTYIDGKPDSGEPESYYSMPLVPRDEGA